MNRTWFSLAPVIATVAVLCSAASAQEVVAGADGGTDTQEWGDLVIRFILEGEAPKPARIPVTKDQAAFGASVEDQSLVVGQDGGLANVLVYLPSTEAPLHPEVMKAAGKEAELSIENGLLQPRILPLMIGQGLKVTNPTPVGINLDFQTRTNLPLNPLIVPQGDYMHRFERVEKIPVPVACNIHPWMRAYLLPLAHPYAGVSDDDGVMRLGKVPVGRWAFRFWHEKAGFLKRQDGGSKEFTLDVESGRNRWDVLVDSELSVMHVHRIPADHDPGAAGWVFVGPQLVDRIVRQRGLVEIDTIGDSISTQQDIRLRSTFGEAMIRPGDVKLIDLGEDLRETFFSWGDDARDRIGSYDDAFRWLKFDWNRDGKLRITIYKGGSQFDASKLNTLKGFSLRGVAESSVEALSQKYARLEQDTARLAEEWRRLGALDGEEPSAKLRRAQLEGRLRETVAAAFEARQQLQRAEVAQLAGRLAGIEQMIAGREQLRNSIIDRRVQELLNPDLQWQPAKKKP